VADEPTLFDPAVWDALTSPASRLPVGAAALDADPRTVARFLAKCAPFDDEGHRWWLGAVDDGGYGRFQAGSGPALVTTTAHRYADRLENGPIPPGAYDRHRCDEPLCTAPAHLERGTAADNRWDTITRPVRAADLDLRGPAGRSRAIRASVRVLVARGITDPALIGIAARSAMLLGDPYRDQLSLFSLHEVRRAAAPPARNGRTW
jgi:hypothetical protein